MNYDVHVLVLPCHSGAMFTATEPEKGLLEAQRHARIFLEKDPRRTHAIVTVTTPCRVCHGAGRTLIDSHKWEFEDCEACAGSGIAERVIKEEIRR